MYNNSKLYVEQKKLPLKKYVTYKKHRIGDVGLREKECRGKIRTKLVQYT